MDADGVLTLDLSANPRVRAIKKVRVWAAGAEDYTWGIALRRRVTSLRVVYGAPPSDDMVQLHPEIGAVVPAILPQTEMLLSVDFDFDRFMSPSGTTSYFRIVPDGDGVMKVTHLWPPPEDLPRR